MPEEMIMSVHQMAKECENNEDREDDSDNSNILEDQERDNESYEGYKNLLSLYVKDN